MDNSPENLLKEGRLDEALQSLTAQVRAHPADAKRRVFLFQLLAVLGQWERAQNQLAVAGELDPQNALMVGAYNVALAGERERVEVLEGRRAPVIIGEPAQWVALLLQALKLNAEGRHAQAAALREQAFEQADAVGGAIDGAPFEWMADADPRFGPCLEVITKGGYAWAPFSRISQLVFEAPTDLRDKIWAPVQITWANGGQAVGFVPARYPGAERATEGDIVLARATDWLDLGDDFQVARGQRMLATDAGEYPLLDVRAITFAAA
ncbi:type VI secretion system accessory protein TagJ [Dyella sp.]|uniref:type VI secretion system accessory protein TagJ n=1 Tax=Dyella sp. TaxID=1869338 RepID=UPI002D773EC5|nr:type VI secretion system accessory protein TagJ [Dyella sp.]HET6432038.1 type VI secretion system accessory protein TagJ [Dyella sp.]